MEDVLDLVQTTLDTLLSGDGVRAFWGRRADIKGDPTDAEYVIYRIDDDSAMVSADGDLYYRNASVSLQYYVKYSTGRTASGRRKATKRMKEMMKSMRSVGFGCPGGWREIGDVDRIGYATFRSEYDIPHEMNKD